MTAYVLVQTQGREGRIAGLLREVPGIVFAEDVQGPYDALALVRSDAEGGQVQTVLDRVRGLPGVIRALAAPVARGSVAAGPAA